MNWMTVLRLLGPTVVQIVIPKAAEFLQQLILDAIAEAEMRGGTSDEKLKYATKIVKGSMNDLSVGQIQDTISATVDATNKVHVHTPDSEPGL
jgi:hypothetical protein